MATKNFVKLEKLPSKGIPYPDGLEIHVRPYTFGEEKSITTSTMSYREQFQLVLSGVELSGPVFNVFNLTMQDVIWIGLYRRLISIGTLKFKIPYKDSKGEKHYHTFTNEDLDFRDIKAEKLPLKVKLEGVELQFKPLTLNQFLWLEEKKYIGNGSMKGASILAKMACWSNDLGYSFESVLDIISNVTDPSDKQVLEEITELLDHGLKPLKLIDSDNKAIKVEIAGRQSLILPFHEDRRSIGNRIYT